MLPSANALASVKVKIDPAVTEAALTMLRDGKGWKGSVEPAGQETMKEAAKVKIWRALIAVSKACGIGGSRRAVLMNVWWRDSTVTIEAAAERILPSVTRGAAPRYLEKKSEKQFEICAN